MKCARRWGSVTSDPNLAGGIHLAERLRTVFSASRIPSGEGKGSVRTTASFGVACAAAVHPGCSRVLRDLIVAADKLMYEARRGGRDCVRALGLDA
jgi:PleD family two-component response regulator